MRTCWVGIQGKNRGGLLHGSPLNQRDRVWDSLKPRPALHVLVRQQREADLPAT